jgi:Rad3-related DNA helicase
MKPIFFETRKTSTVIETFIRYKEQALKPKGALLMAVVRAKFAEGIDFSDELARAIFIVSVPNLQSKNLYVILKKFYKDD